jgi:hypothetical protein
MADQASQVHELPSTPDLAGALLAMSRQLGEISAKLDRLPLFPGQPAQPVQLPAPPAADPFGGLGDLLNSQLGGIGTAAATGGASKWIPLALGAIAAAPALFDMLRRLIHPPAPAAH